MKMMVRCNSLLSSVYIRTNAGATVQANYFDTTSGDETSPERYNLRSHDPLTAVGVTDRILVPKIHNKPQLEVVVTGGTVEFGVYATAVSTSASDIDQSLVEHLQDAVINSDRGIIVAGYDAAIDKYFFLPIEDGALKIKGVVTTVAGGVATPKNTTFITSATPDTETSVALAAVKRFRITNRGNAVLKYSFLATESGSNYASLYPNGTVEEEGILSANVTIYMQSPNPSQRVELVSWT